VTFRLYTSFLKFESHYPFILAILVFVSSFRKFHNPICFKVSTFRNAGGAPAARRKESSIHKE
jgi:hypothetical protein